MIESMKNSISKYIKTLTPSKTSNKKLKFDSDEEYVPDQDSITSLNDYDLNDSDSLLDISMDSDDLYRDPTVIKKIKLNNKSKKVENGKNDKNEKKQKVVKQQPQELTAAQLRKQKKIQKLEKIRQIEEDKPKYLKTTLNSNQIKNYLKEVQDILNDVKKNKNYQQDIIDLIQNRKLKYNHINKVYDLVKQNIKNLDKDQIFNLLLALNNEFFIQKPLIEESYFFPGFQKLFLDQENIYKVANVIKSAKKTLDIAIFALTNDIIKKAILYAHKQNCKVRIITDDECSKFQGADIWELAAEGIECTMDNHPRYHMHNKFALIDKFILITGSFNWTAQAVFGNQENLIIIHNENLIKEYEKEFNKLWIQFKDFKLDQKESALKIQNDQIERQKRVQEAKDKALLKKKQK